MERYKNCTFYSVTHVPFKSLLILEIINTLPSLKSFSFLFTFYLTFLSQTEHKGTSLYIVTVQSKWLNILFSDCFGFWA